MNSVRFPPASLSANPVTVVLATISVFVLPSIVMILFFSAVVFGWQAQAQAQAQAQTQESPAANAGALWNQLEDNYPRIDEPTQDKLRWTSAYFNFVQVAIPKDSRKAFVYASGSYAFLLFPELSFSEVETALAQQAKNSGLELTVSDFRKIENLTAPEDCPSKTLLNSVTAEGALRRSEQKFGICYVYAGVRAADYYNYSTGRAQPLTSILATAMSDNAGYPSRGLNLEWGGYPETIVQQLMSGGGCQITAWDRLPGSAGEARLDLMKGATEQINRTLVLFNQGRMAEALVSVTLWTSVTKELVGGVLKLNLFAGQRPDLQKLSSLIKIYEAKARDTAQYMSLAEFVYRQAFCSSQLVSYSPGRVQALIKTRDRVNTLHPLQLQSLITANFGNANPQPLMISLFADPIQDVTSRTRSISHAALIIGQKYDQKIKQCKYQILDSNPPPFWDPRLESNAQTGTVWLPLIPLNRSLFQLSVIDEKVEALRL